MQLFLRAWPYLVCLFLGAAGAWYLAPGPQACPAIGKLAQSQTTSVQHVVTKTTKPDGTTVVRQEDKQVEQEHTQSSPTPSPSKSKYSLGLDYMPSFDTKPSLRDFRLEAAARLGDLNLWGVSGYDIKHNQVSLGLRYEW